MSHVYKFLQAVNIGNIICEFYEPSTTKEFQAEVKIRKGNIHVNSRWFENDPFRFEISLYNWSKIQWYLRHTDSSIWITRSSKECVYLIE